MECHGSLYHYSTICIIMSTNRLNERHVAHPCEGGGGGLGAVGLGLLSPALSRE